VAEKLNLRHQICQFHVRLWVGKALKELRETVPKDWQWILDEHEPDVPWTNNAIERAIGQMKMRARTVRGYKTWEGMHNGLLIAGTTGD
jgi:hypothetical protein